MTKSAGCTCTTYALPGLPFETRPAADGPATGCSYILVTPDGERTMNTYLGAAQELMPADIDAAQVAASALLYLEGYLWDPTNAKEAFVKASTIAHGAGPSGRADAIGLILRGSLLRRIYRPDAKRHGRSGVRQRGRTARALPDLGFRNGAEAIAQRRQTRGGGDAQREGLRGGLERWRHRGCRRSRSRESWTPQAPAIYSPPAFYSGLRAAPVTKNAGRLGALAAAEVIQHIGARPQVSLKELAQQNGLPGVVVGARRRPTRHGRDIGERRRPSDGYARP